MGLKDRGKIKWQGAFFMPEHQQMLNELKKDYYRQAKPILDQYQLEESENKICYAMEFTFLVKITAWEDGFEWDYEGLVHRLDPIHKMIYLEQQKDDYYIIKIHFSDIVRVEVIEENPAFEFYWGL
ncbi:YolD-like family protein [Bacillus sp. V5-8f]|uniref:YolD-like family protein n=1 Tax=Bacillus sp. V5-8f TaxID=2053044 RepID=UPI000C78CE83|nr:YolD-like family protein [Bacillus sp. V5-8f]PLT32746.1 YolD-like family protein [Bacillus sp. V5-8f]